MAQSRNGPKNGGGKVMKRPISRRIIKSVLHNFLGTYTSRNSDFHGYWLFGFLVEDINQINVDLLGADRNQENTKSRFNRGGALQRFVYSFFRHPYPYYAYRSPIAYAEWLAAQRFAEQICKAALPRSWFREARLEITRSADTRIGVVVREDAFYLSVRRMAKIDRRECSGYEMRFSAQVITDLGRTYQEELSVFVAPHDPGEERRRGFWWLP